MVNSAFRAPAYFTEEQKTAFETVGKILSEVPEAELLIAPLPGEKTIWLGINGKLSSAVIEAMENITDLGVFAIEPVSMEELDRMEGRKYVIQA